MVFAGAILLVCSGLVAVSYLKEEVDDTSRLGGVRKKMVGRSQRLEGPKNSIAQSENFEFHSDCLFTNETHHTFCGCSSPIEFDYFKGGPIDHKLSVPPGRTYLTVDRSHLIDGIAVSLAWVNETQGVLSAWRCNKNGTTTQVSTQGFTFVGFATNSEIRTKLHLVSDGSNHSVRVPDCTPPGNYNFTIVLRHIGGQGVQDPPCFQSRTVRTHCINETLWLDQFSNWFEIDNISYSKPCRSLSTTTRSSRLAGLAPGYWNMTSIKWTPTTQFTASTGPPAAGNNLSKKALLVGDSTFRNLNTAASSGAFTTYVEALMPMDLQRLLASEIRLPLNDTVLFLGIGLHSVCYNPLRPDMDQMTHILPQLKAVWKDNLVIRSTPFTGVIRGLDYNDQKCLYLTPTRLKVWNDHVKHLASENNITYWDIFDFTASVGPSPEKWAETDGTHYCSPNTGSVLCQEMVSMVWAAL